MGRKTRRAVRWVGAVLAVFVLYDLYQAGKKRITKT